MRCSQAWSRVTRTTPKLIRVASYRDPLGSRQTRPTPTMLYFLMNNTLHYRHMNLSRDGWVGLWVSFACSTMTGRTQDYGFHELFIDKELTIWITEGASPLRALFIVRNFPYLRVLVKEEVKMRWEYPARMIRYIWIIHWETPSLSAGKACGMKQLWIHFKHLLYFTNVNFLSFFFFWPRWPAWLPRDLNAWRFLR